MLTKFIKTWLSVNASLQNNESIKRGFKRAKNFPLFYRIAFIVSSFILSIVIYINNLLIHKSQRDLFNSLRTNNHIYLRGIYIFSLFPFIGDVFSKKRQFPKQHKHPLDKKINKKVDQKDFDFIIIGSGAGGAPVAERLSREGYNVALIEKGGIVRPGESQDIVDKHYIAGGLTASITNGIFLIVSGQSLGGTTSINLGTMLRPKKENLSLWDEKLGTNFSSNKFQQFLEQAEQDTNTRGVKKSEYTTSGKIFTKGAQELELGKVFPLKHSFLHSQEERHLLSEYPNLPIHSTDHSYLVNAAKNGCRIYSGLKAEKIVENNNKVKVTAKDNDKNYNFTAKKLIISAGPIYTPQLIRKNKLGRKWQEAGNHLKIHPASTVYAFLPNISNKNGIPQDVGLIVENLPRILFEGAKVPIEMAALNFIVNSQDPKWWIEHYENVLNFGALIHDRNTGYVRNILNNHYINYELNPKDARELGEAMLLIAKVYFNMGAEKVLLPLAITNSTIGSMQELNNFDVSKFTPDKISTAAFHAQGTAGMGRLVDTDQKLIGSERIYVNDASILPDSPGVNPQLTIMALSLRLADSLNLD